MKKTLREKILEKHGGASVGVTRTSRTGWKYVVQIYDTKFHPLDMSAYGDTEKQALENLLAKPKKGEEPATSSQIVFSRAALTCIEPKYLRSKYVGSLTNHELVDVRAVFVGLIEEIDSELRERDGRHRIAHMPHGVKT